MEREGKVVYIPANTCDKLQMNVLVPLKAFWLSEACVIENLEKLPLMPLMSERYRAKYHSMLTIATKHLRDMYSCVWRLTS